MLETLLSSIKEKVVDPKSSIFEILARHVDRQKLFYSSYIVSKLPFADQVDAKIQIDRLFVFQICKKENTVELELRMKRCFDGDQNKWLVRVAQYVFYGDGEIRLVNRESTYDKPETVVNDKPVRGFRKAVVILQTKRLLNAAYTKEFRVDDITAREMSKRKSDFQKVFDWLL